MTRALPFALVVALGAGSLLFDFGTVARLPSLEDWAEASAAIRPEPGDAVQVWPWWADRARRFMPAVLAEEHPLEADYAFARRLWVIGFRPLAPSIENAQHQRTGAGIHRGKPQQWKSISIRETDRE